MAPNEKDLKLEIRQLHHQLNEARFRADSTAVATQLAAERAIEMLNGAHKRIQELSADLSLANARIAELNPPSQSPELPPIGEVLKDQTVSHWLVSSLHLALTRDPVDAANDAEFLAALLRRRARESK